MTGGVHTAEDALKAIKDRSQSVGEEVHAKAVELAEKLLSQAPPERVAVLLFGGSAGDG